jgi:predicted ester cyclase
LCIFHFSVNHFYKFDKQKIGGSKNSDDTMQLKK